jgi:hypothetical protein
VIKLPKDKKVKPTGPSEVHQPVVGEADFREADPGALVQPFAPMVEQRPTCAYHLSHPDIFVMESAEQWDCCE